MRRTFLVRVEIESNTIDSTNIEEEIWQRLGKRIVRKVDAVEETE